jgi:RNA 3'-terminal phosphate cyclase
VAHGRRSVREPADRTLIKAAIEHSEPGNRQDNSGMPARLSSVPPGTLRRSWQRSITIAFGNRAEVTRPGYVPQGAGVLELTVTPVSRELAALTLTRPGLMREVRGIAVASHLAERRVSDRMASACQEHLMAAGLSCAIERVDEGASVRQPTPIV